MEKTPHVRELYAQMFPSVSSRRNALGLTSTDLQDVILDEGLDGLLERIKTDDALVREHALDPLRETLTLGYPSYIFALAMGAGKTILIGAIIATEFAMAIEYPDGEKFVENALVFAPGKTIIGSLRELAMVPYDEILPPRFYKRFAASSKLTFTRVTAARSGVGFVPPGRVRQRAPGSAGRVRSQGHRREELPRADEHIRVGNAEG